MADAPAAGQSAIQVASQTASLGMYDPPWLHAANDLLWAGIARRLSDAGVAGVPAGLDRSRPLDAIWRDPDLLLAQTCGLPLRTALRGRVRVVATPVYDAPLAHGGWNRAAIMVREDAAHAALADLRGSVAAVNSVESNSGMNLFRAALAPIAEGRPMFARVVETGAHLASLAAVAAGGADVASIDGVTLALAMRHRPDLVAGLRVLDVTPDTPGLPLVTRADAPDEWVALLRAALTDVLEDEALAEARQALLLTGLDVLPEETYDRVIELEQAAVDAGYPALE